MRVVMDLLDASALFGMVPLVFLLHLQLHLSWIFDTSSEAAYPPLPCQRVVACLIQIARARNFDLEKPCNSGPEQTDHVSQIRFLNFTNHLQTQRFSLAQN